MSTLENQIKSILTALILGQEILLTANDQRLLATWIAKTVMTAEFAKPDLIGIPNEQRLWLMERGEPPEGWNIWIGRSSGTRWLLDLYHHVVDLVDAVPHVVPNTSGSAHPRNTQTTTFGLGHLLVHTFSSTVPKRRIVELPNQRRGTMQRIWLPSGAEIPWPPSSFVSDVEADAIANTLSRTLGMPSFPLN